MMKKYIRAERGRAFIYMIVALLLSGPAVGYGFDMNEMNRFYQTKQCPKCDLTYATFVRLKAPQANLVDARCKGINLSDAILDHSDMSNTDLSGAKLFGADLRGTKLQRANLKGANLIISDLREADLSNANLSEANLKGANLTGAKIEGADFSGATWFDWEKCRQGSIGECKK
jgi:uncharacterized protein YjbI with pentapeptide repeats